MKPAKLKPCPFCGRVVKCVEQPWKEWLIECFGPRNTHYCFSKHASRAVAIRGWNLRKKAKR